MITNEMNYFKESDRWSTRGVILRVSAFFGVHLVLIFSLQIILGQLLYSFFQGSKIASTLLLSLAGIIGVSSTYVFLRYDRKKFDFVGFTHFPPRNILIGAIITLVVLIPTVFLEMHLGILTSGGLLSWEVALITIILTFLGVGVGEEITYRGYIESIIEVKGKQYEIIAIIVSSLLFGFTHFYVGILHRSLAYMVIWGISATIFGIGMSLCKKITNDLTLVISIHAFWDIYLFLFIPVFHYDEWMQQIGEIIITIGSVSCLVMLAWILAKCEIIKKRTIREADSK